jgi:hypothetical protein
MPGSYARLQMQDKLFGTFWVGVEAQPDSGAVQLVWESAVDFQTYVNRLLDAFGHLSYAEVDRLAQAVPAVAAAAAGG